MTHAMDPEVADAIWAAIEPILPIPIDEHPLGCHNPRVPDKVCFRGILIRLVTGSSWVDIEAIMNFEVSDTTLRTRRDEWIAAGVFDRLEAEARAGYDRILELDLDVVAIDGSLHKAPCGGEGTGKSPVDRAKHARGLVELDIQRRGTKPPPGVPHRLTLGLRWIVEATNTWWSNYGQLRRSTDRKIRHRHAALQLATVVLIVGRLIDYRNRWSAA